jgi:hypothetical protein
VRLRVGSQNRGSGALPEPTELISAKPHGHNYLWRRKYNLGILPEFFIRGMSVQVKLNTAI